MAKMKLMSTRRYHSNLDIYLKAVAFAVEKLNFAFLENSTVNTRIYLKRLKSIRKINLNLVPFAHVHAKELRELEAVKTRKRDPIQNGIFREYFLCVCVC